MNRSKALCSVLFSILLYSALLTHVNGLPSEITKNDSSAPTNSSFISNGAESESLAEIPRGFKVSVSWRKPSIKCHDIFMSILKAQYEVANRPFDAELARGYFYDPSRPWLPRLNVHGPTISRNFHILYALEKLAWEIHHEMRFTALNFQAFLYADLRVVGSIFLAGPSAPQPEDSILSITNQTMPSDENGASEAEIKAPVADVSLHDRQEGREVASEIATTRSSATRGSQQAALPGLHFNAVYLPTRRMIRPMRALTLLIQAISRRAAFSPDAYVHDFSLQDVSVNLHVTAKHTRSSKMKNAWLIRALLETGRKLYDSNNWRDVRMTLLLGNEEVGWIDILGSVSDEIVD